MIIFVFTRSHRSATLLALLPLALRQPHLLLLLEHRLGRVAFHAAVLLLVALVDLLDYLDVAQLFSDQVDHFMEQLGHSEASLRRDREMPQILVPAGGLALLLLDGLPE